MTTAPAPRSLTTSNLTTSATESVRGPSYNDGEHEGFETAMKIVHYPHPALRHAGRPVTTIDKELQLNIGHMKELMYEAKGLALAAPQVALPFQLLVMNITGDAGQPDREEVFLNPRIVERKGVQQGDEGCLSFPGLYQDVRRAKTIKVQAYDLKGQLVERTISDLEARAWQHEIDHLNGVLFIDMMGPLAKLGARKSIKKFEQEFRIAQQKGEIPENLEIERVLAAIEEQMS